MRKAVTLLIAFGAVVSLSAASFATIIHVPADQPTIQAGIDSAQNGDTVLVAPGTYTGNGNRDIDFGGKGVVLKSENDPDSTIIDCEGSASEPHRGFYFHSGEDSSTVVEGFTIRNGYGLTDSPFPSESVGGGIKCDSSSSPKIINNTISGNSGSAGGGIYCDLQSSPTISNNTIAGNSADWGGGISCRGYSNATISNNTISGNSGGGIFCWYSSPTIRNNTITGNSAVFYGGGIYCYYFSSPTISNNTISGNSADRAGGIYCSGYSNATISNNTISGNSAPCMAAGFLATTIPIPRSATTPSAIIQLTATAAGFLAVVIPMPLSATTPSVEIQLTKAAAGFIVGLPIPRSATTPSAKIQLGTAAGLVAHTIPIPQSATLSLLSVA